jgi:MFS family permease
VTRLAQIRGLPRAARVLLVASGVNSLGNGLVYPLLIVYLTRIHGFGVPVATGAVSLTSFAAFVCGPVAGWSADRLGRGRTVLAAMLLGAAGMAGYAVAATVWQALAAALLVGLGIGAGSVWYALLAESVQPPQRPALFALNFTVMNATMALGALLAGAVAAGGRPWAFRGLYLADAATFVVVGVVIALRHPQRPGAAEPEPPAAGDSPAASAASYRALLADRRILAILAVTLLLYTAGYAQLESGFSAVLVTARGLGARQLAVLFAVNACVVVAAQLFLLPVFRTLEPKRALAVTAVCWAGCWALVLLALDLPGPAGCVVAGCAAIGVFAVGECFLSVGMPTLVNAVATDRNRGRVNGVFGMGTSTGYIAGPLLAGWLLGARLPTAFVLGAGVTCLLAWPLSSAFLPTLDPPAATPAPRRAEGRRPATHR